MILYNFVL